MWLFLGTRVNFKHDETMRFETISLIRRFDEIWRKFISKNWSVILRFHLIAIARKINRLVLKIPDFSFTFFKRISVFYVQRSSSIHNDFIVMMNQIFSTENHSQIYLCTLTNVHSLYDSRFNHYSSSIFKYRYPSFACELRLHRIPTLEMPKWAKWPSHNF